MRTCPKCGSEKVSLFRYMGVECIRCTDCGYDESVDIDTTPDSRSSQKAKGHFSPYKAGGKGRTAAKK
ncbi:hypothetical protein COV19_04670 [Candidatus Woesearchaeota archaeon CG10_big_fil_rev_8_21_14_0_10_44_13]|nr:MAG: hypothetical protein COV19_04670 [Candidatus Woesearchaeota archaeon CG10_big_fil_rev_8_21_14_0_10_44_13]